jgi:S-adenosylmethionine:tRNA ribosyltransferase-isomerase
VDTSAFDFELPDDLIAQQPVEPRDAARLLVVRRDSGRLEHRTVRDLPDLLDRGDLLVRNDTRVVPARLVGRRAATGGKWEGLFLRTLPHPPNTPLQHWEVLATTRGKPAPGEIVLVEHGENEQIKKNETLTLTLLEKVDGGRWVVRPEAVGAATDLLERFGRVPLPPYIRRGQEGPGDRLRYQTLYARAPGAVAAPTAGLHYTADLFARLADRGVGCADVTLHVGLGTFRPIEAVRIEDHVLHAEWAELSPATAATLNAARARGGRVVAVGTTSARVLETAAAGGETRDFRPFVGETALYLRPGHDFRGVDALFTNFHLPRSSLLVLVSAFGGHDLIRAAYAAAVAERYRFYSYGDAMLVL